MNKRNCCPRRWESKGDGYREVWAYSVRRGLDVASRPLLEVSCCLDDK